MSNVTKMGAPRVPKGSSLPDGLPSPLGVQADSDGTLKEEDSSHNTS